MCLVYELSKKQSEKIIKQARKRGYIRVWKCCWKKNGEGRTGQYSQSLLYKKGIRKAKNLKVKNAGWYAFLSKTGAKRSLISGDEIKVCFAKPSWIKRLGGYTESGRAGIFTKLAFPDWDRGTMTVREFREMCKNV